jgi:hypothetical protein
LNKASHITAVTTPVDHGVTVGAYDGQIIQCYPPSFFVEGRKWDEMMNLGVSPTHLAIHLLEVETTVFDLTNQADPGLLLALPDLLISQAGFTATMPGKAPHEVALNMLVALDFTGTVLRTIVKATA